MYESAKIVHMSKTTINLKDELVEAAIKATGVKGKTAVIHLGLEELIKRAAIERLIARAGKDPKASVPARKRSGT